jgi:hypothetical protein
MRVASIFTTAAAAAMLASATPASIRAQDAQPPAINVDVDTDGDAVWYADPLWLSIGGIALVLIVLIAVMSGRRDTTTVVK